MTLSDATFSIDGQNALTAQGWQINDAEGGYDQASGVITEAEWRQIGSPSQGEAVIVRTEGSVIFSGRIAQPPQLTDGLAYFAAVGLNAKADQKGARLFIQSCDTSIWVPYDAEPHLDGSDRPNYEHSRKIGLDSTKGALRFSLTKDQALGGGTSDAADFIFYAQGVDLRRLAFTMTYDAGDEFAKLQFKTKRANGPIGAATTVDTYLLNAGNRDAQKSSTHAVASQDIWILELQCNDATFAPNAQRMVWMATKPRVNSDITSADSYNASDVVSYIGTQMGWDVSGVDSSTFDVLPFDWDNGSWLDALTYAADLEDNYVRVGDGAIEYGVWGARAWTVTQARDARPDLKPLELANQVRMLYETGAGVPRKVVRSTTDVGITDPLAASGLTNTIEASMEDPQKSDVVPTAVADKLVRRYARERYAGTLEVVSGSASDGTDNVRLIRYGDTITIDDWAPGRNVTLRVVEVSQSHDSVRIGVEQPINLAHLMAHQGAGKRRHHKRRNGPRRVKGGGAAHVPG